MAYDNPAHAEISRLVLLRRREIGQMHLALDRKTRELEELEASKAAYERSVKASIKRPDGAERVLTRDLRGPLAEILAEGPLSVGQIAAALERRGIVLGVPRNRLGEMAKAGDTIFQEARGVYGLLEEAK